MSGSRSRQASAGGATGGDKAEDTFFKECKGWKVEIHRLWEKVGNILGKRTRGGEGVGTYPEEQERFRYNIRGAEARPSNTTVRELMGSGAYTEAVFFLRATDVGKVKAGVLGRGAGEGKSF